LPINNITTWIHLNISEFGYETIFLSKIFNYSLIYVAERPSALLSFDYEEEGTVQKAIVYVMADGMHFSMTNQNFIYIC
jgi:hypothetical protein